MSNRIGSACWYQEYTSQGKWSAWLPGTLHHWGTDYQEFETGPGLFPIGVIEDHRTLRCKSIPVDHICFAANPE